MEKKTVSCIKHNVIWKKISEINFYREEEIQTLKEETAKVSNELNEVREQEVNCLKEELSDKTEALKNAEINIKSMETQVTQLIKENESLSAEKERLTDECTQQ